MCGWARSAVSMERAVCESLKAIDVAAFSPMTPASTRASRKASSRSDDRSYTPSAAIVMSSATRLVSIKPVISFVRIERSRNRGMCGTSDANCSVVAASPGGKAKGPRAPLLRQPGVSEVPDHGRLDPPDVPRVLGNGPVGGEPTHAGDVEQRLAAPLDAIEPSLVDALLRGDVGLEVGQVDVLVPGARQLGHDGTEEVLVAAREVPRGDGIDDAPDVTGGQ